MLGKGVVGGGSGTKAPKPSFVSYVRPEVRGHPAGGASGWSCRGAAEPLPCRGRFLPVCGRAAGRGEALGRAGASRGPVGDLRCRQAGARARGPVRWPSGEGARAALTTPKSWGSGYRWRGRAGRSGARGGGPPRSPPPEGVCPPLGISQ